MILWVATEEFDFKADARVITAEEVDVYEEKDFMVEVEEEADIADEAIKTWDIYSPDPMPEWYSVTMACR